MPRGERLVTVSDLLTHNTPFFSGHTEPLGPDLTVNAWWLHVGQTQNRHLTWEVFCAFLTGKCFSPLVSEDVQVSNDENSVDIQGSSQFAMLPQRLLLFAFIILAYVTRSLWFCSYSLQVPCETIELSTIGFGFFPQTQTFPFYNLIFGIWCVLYIIRFCHVCSAENRCSMEIFVPLLYWLQNESHLSAHLAIGLTVSPLKSPTLVILWCSILWHNIEKI